MSAPAATMRRTPYVGLDPFTERDRAYFFGRAADEEVVVANLHAAPLTIIYGTSGVGKTSLLMAGVIPQLKERPGAAVVMFRAWQLPEFAAALKYEIAVAVGIDAEADIPFALALDDFLLWCNEHTHRIIFMILDQFEEYFLYHSGSHIARAFDAELARAINREDVEANFVFSIREDSLAALDQFKERIPYLFDNYLRIEHLDLDAAKAAIEMPIEQYNREFVRDEHPYAIEDTLVRSVLDQVRPRALPQGQEGRGFVKMNGDADTANVQIETPYLQIVMRRLWEAEARAGSRTLREETLAHLGGAPKIVQDHLDSKMKRLPRADRRVAAALFRYLVTPSRTKIAHSAGTLAEYTKLWERRVDSVLRMLARPDMRILRQVTSPNTAPHFEIFHDVLAEAVLDWRKRELDRERNRRMALAASIGLILVGSTIGLFFAQARSAGAKRSVAVSRAVAAQATTSVVVGSATSAQATTSIVVASETSAKTTATVIAAVATAGQSTAAIIRSSATSAQASAATATAVAGATTTANAIRATSVSGNSTRGAATNSAQRSTQPVIIVGTPRPPSSPTTVRGTVIATPALPTFPPTASVSASDKSAAALHLQSGQEALDRNDPGTALRECSQAIQLNPSDRFFLAQAYFCRGTADNDENQNEDAIADFTVTIAYDATFDLAFLQRGLLYVNVQGDCNAGVPDLQRYLRGKDSAFVDAASNAIASCSGASSIYPRGTR